MEEQKAEMEAEEKKKPGILERIRSKTPTQKKKATTIAACFAVAFVVLCYVQF